LHSGMLFYASHLFDVMGTCMILWVHVHDCIIYIYLPPSIYLCISDCMEWSYYIARALMFFCFCDDGFWAFGSVCIVCCIPVTQSPSFSNLDSLAQYLKQSISEPGLFLALYSEPWSCRNLVFPSPVPRIGLVGTWFFPARYHQGSFFEPGFLWPGTWPVRVFVAICYYFVIQIAPSADTFWVFFCSYPGSISQLQF
jgi:hypothetical protein